jgi:hypothetical protein
LEEHLSEGTDRADQENFGEAGLGDAQAENAPNDPEMLEDTDAEDASGSDDLTDVPAFEPAPSDATAIEEEEAAAEEAGAIGGHTPSQGLDPAEQAVSEGGEGEAEGFELAEEELIESASHGTPAGNPLGDRYPAEESASEDLASYGEADHVEVSEDDTDDEDDDQ